jgi:hypothetical protein
MRMNKIDGYKTYIVAIAAAVLGILEASGTFTLPQWAWPVLFAAGFGGIRSGMKKLEKK